eukprot:m.157535 g.157535  ORF g.157535 m.157535 type:complete len:53 (-) comp23669_c0_seq1:1471-1629(-)
MRCVRQDEHHAFSVLNLRTALTRVHAAYVAKVCPIQIMRSTNASTSDVTIDQ